MTLFKRGRYWWTGFYVEGKRIQQSTGSSNRRQAELVENKLKAEANLASFNIRLQNPKLTFHELAEQFKEKAKTSIFHTGRFKFLEAFFGEMPVVTITKNTAAEYRNHRQTHDGPIKDSTLNRDIAVLRRIFYWAQEQGLIATNPMAHVGMVRERRIKKPILSVEHEELLLTVAKPHMKAFILAAVDTGMRRGELFKQAWEDIDLERGILFVTQSKTAEGESREIPLTERLLTLLKEKAKKMDPIVGPIFTFQGALLAI